MTDPSPHTVVHMSIPSPRRPTTETDPTMLAPPKTFVSKRAKRKKRDVTTAACGGEGETQFEMDEVGMMIGEWESPC